MRIGLPRFAKSNENFLSESVVFFYTSALVFSYFTMNADILPIKKGLCRLAASTSTGLFHVFAVLASSHSNRLHRISRRHFYFSIQLSISNTGLQKKCAFYFEFIFLFIFLFITFFICVCYFEFKYLFVFLFFHFFRF